MKEMDKKKKLVPKLRFKGYTDSWKKGTIGDYYQNLRTGMTPSRTRPDYFKGNIPWISSGELNYGFIEKTTESITQEAIENTNLRIYPTNTLFIAITGLEAPGTRGKCAINKVPAATNQSCLAFEEIEDVSTLFLFQWYKKNGIWLYFNFAQGTKQQSFNNKLISGFTFNIPTLPEQQKIASFLSAIDEKIQQLTRKKELLEQYKKGVMQQIFSGKLRFKDKNGKAFPKWEVKRLGDVGEFKNGLNKDKNDFGFGSPFVNLMDVFGKKELNNQPFDLVNSNDSEKELYSMQKGDVLFIRSSVKRSGVGEAVVVNEDLPQTVYSGFLIRFRDNRKILDQKFKKYCFANYSFRKELLSYATTSANTNINQESLGFVKLHVPVVEEQKKIANYLSNLDNKIEIITNQITQTQTFKKGLLQQMFV